MCYQLYFHKTIKYLQFFEEVIIFFYTFANRNQTNILIMAHAPYLSRDEAGMLDDLQVFKDNLPAVASSLDITPQKIAAIEKDYALAYWIFYGLKDANSQVKQLTAAKNLIFLCAEGIPVQEINLVPIPDAPSAPISGVITRYRAIVKSIKAHANYTEQIGKLLGIIGAEIVIDETQMKPTALVKEIADNKIVINVTKGHAEQIAIYCYRYVEMDAQLAQGQDEKFDFIGMISHPPYVDHRLNISRKPETRKYKFYYLLNDKIVGQSSDIIILTARVYVSADGNEMAGKIS